MTTPAHSIPTHSGRALFVSIPVADLERSKAFFTALGFAFDPNHGKFAEHAKLPMADATTSTLALYSPSVASREEVDSVAEAARAAGGVEADGLEDYGFMCSRSFVDLDGHGWQVMWMDPAGPQGGSDDVAPSMQAVEVPA